jgi:hypothetical protein
MFPDVSGALIEVSNPRRQDKIAWTKRASRMPHRGHILTYHVRAKTNNVQPMTNRAHVFS